MAYYRHVGDVPRTRHTAFRDDDSNLRYEELMGEEGFSSDSSLLYHRGVPSAIVDSQPWELPDLATTPNHPLKPRHLKLHDLPTGGDPVTGRRAGDGQRRRADQLRGERRRLAVLPQRRRRRVRLRRVRVGLGRDRVRVAGLPHRRLRRHPARHHSSLAAERHRGEVSRLYAIEANSHIAPPKRYLSRYGQFLEHAPYCERDLHGPTEPLVLEGTDVEVLVKHRGNGPSGLVGSRLTYATHPLDVVGWDGCLYPYTFNVEDFMPITGKVHQPPPVHQVFEGYNFVVCNFCPRKVDYHEQSIPVPYYHSNVDSDEVMFYVGGDYEARKGSGINIGSISIHPGGHAHGPQPSAIEASIGVEYFDELAVMVDTFRPLELGEAGLAVEDPAYAWTWSGRGPEGDDPAVFSNS